MTSLEERLRLGWLSCSVRLEARAMGCDWRSGLAVPRLDQQPADRQLVYGLGRTTRPVFIVHQDVPVYLKWKAIDPPSALAKWGTVTAETNNSSELESPIHVLFHIFFISFCLFHTTFQRAHILHLVAQHQSFWWSNRSCTGPRGSRIKRHGCCSGKGLERHK